MPTENRSSNTEMVSFPRELSDDLAELIATRARVCGGGAFEIWEAICEAFAAPVQQPHPEPIAWMVGTAFWWTKKEAERDAAETGLPIVGLGPMTGATSTDLQQGEPVALSIPDECPHIIVFDDADRANEHFCGAGARTAALRRYEQISQSWNAHLFVRIARNSRDDRYPSAEVAEPGEVERLRADVETMRRKNNEYWHETEVLRAWLAEAQTLMNRAVQAWAAADTIKDVHTVMAALRDALSASAEPSAPVERDDETLIDALRTCEKWFIKHSPTAPLIGGFGDAEHPMLTCIRAALECKP